MPAPWHGELDVSGVSEEGHELSAYSSADLLTRDMTSTASPNAQAIAILEADISEAAQRWDFAGFYTGNNPKDILSEIRQKRFPRPIVRSAPGLFLAEDPNIWANNDL